MSFGNIKHAKAVDAHAEIHLVPEQRTEAFKNAYNTAKHGMPAIALTPLQGKFLSLLASMSGARNVLEIGTLGGYSSLWLAHTLKGGKVTSIEIDPERRQIATNNLKAAGLEAEILLGAGMDVLPKLEKEIDEGNRERFDFAFIDADWENQYNYVDWSVKLSKGKGSVIVVDNAVREMIESGIVGGKRDESAADVVALVGNDDRVEATLIQTVGSKDYDGFLLALVK